MLIKQVSYSAIHIVSTAKVAGSHDIRREKRAMSDEIPFLRNAQHRYSNQCKLHSLSPCFLFTVASFLFFNLTRCMSVHVYILQYAPLTLQEKNKAGATFVCFPFYPIAAVLCIKLFVNKTLDWVGR